MSVHACICAARRKWEDAVGRVRGRTEGRTEGHASNLHAPLEIDFESNDSVSMVSVSIPCAFQETHFNITNGVYQWRRAPEGRGREACDPALEFVNKPVENQHFPTLTAPPRPALPNL